MSTTSVAVYMIKPLLVGLFTTTGAGVPIALLLWRYSKSEKRRLNKTLPLVDEEIRTWESMKDGNEDTAHKFRVRAKEDMDTNTLSPDKLGQYLTILNKADDSLRVINNKLAELQQRKQYIIGYNFWTVIENFIERRYVNSGASNK